jgi:hypothetical protein
MLINPKYQVLPPGIRDLMSDPDIHQAVRTATAQAKQRSDTTEICQTDLQHHYQCRDNLTPEQFYHMLDSLDTDALKCCMPKHWHHTPANPDHIINNWLTVSNALLTRLQQHQQMKWVLDAEATGAASSRQVLSSSFNYQALQPQYAAEINTNKQYRSKYWRAIWGIYSAWIKSAVEADVLNRWTSTQADNLWEFPESAGV